MNCGNELLLLIAATLYLILLSFSPRDRMLQLRRFGLALLGLTFGFIFTSTLVTIIELLTRYSLSGYPWYSLVYAPIVEEIMKFCTILVLGWMIQGSISKSEMIVLSGSVGLGFGIIETLGYILNGASPAMIIWRLLITLPLHICSCFVIGSLFTEKKNILLIVAILFHAASNFLAGVNFLFEIPLVYSLFLFFFYSSENDYAEAKRLSQKIRAIIWLIDYWRERFASRNHRLL